MPKKKSPQEAKQALIKRYTETGNSYAQAEKKAAEQLRGYDRRHPDKK